MDCYNCELGLCPTAIRGLPESAGQVHDYLANCGCGCDDDYLCCRRACVVERNGCKLGSDEIDVLNAFVSYLVCRCKQMTSQLRPLRVVWQTLHYVQMTPNTKEHIDQDPAIPSSTTKPQWSSGEDSPQTPLLLDSILGLRALD